MQEEIVELVRPDPRLGALHRAARVGRDQLGRDLGGENRRQDRVGFAVELVGSHAPANQELDQRLRQSGIDGIMAHLVADAVRAPAERKFRQVARADHKPAALIGEAEQIVGA